MSQRTPLFDVHVAAGGRMVDFAGWEMPVQYRGILDEHRAVREGCGVFDISHMGQFFVTGEGLEECLTNRVGLLSVGDGQYTLMLNDRGGIIDDLIVYRVRDREFLLVVNAAKIAEDAAWLGGRVVFEDASDRWAALAVQGPQAAAVHASVFGVAMPGKNQILSVAGGGFSAGTGYTGEAGFEVFVPSEDVVDLWHRVVGAGAMPCGLGARDTLRLEMGYPLNGADLSPERTPLEAGLACFVDFEKGDFVGRAALVAQRAAGLAEKLCALRVDEKSPPIRSHYGVFAGGERVAETTSGALSPSLGVGIAMAYLPVAFAAPGTQVEIDVRGRRYAASVVKKPFYTPKS